MVMDATDSTGQLTRSWDRSLLRYGTDYGFHCGAERCQQLKQICFRCTLEPRRSASRHYIAFLEAQGFMSNPGQLMTAPQTSPGGHLASWTHTSRSTAQAEDH